MQPVQTGTHALPCKYKRLHRSQSRATQPAQRHIGFQMTCRVPLAKHADWSSLLQGPKQEVKPSMCHRLRMAMNQAPSSKVLIVSP